MAQSKVVIVFKEHVGKDQVDDYAKRVEESGGRVHSRFDTVLKGFSASLSEHILSSFQANELVDYIEPDDEVTS